MRQQAPVVYRKDHTDAGQSGWYSERGYKGGKWGQEQAMIEKRAIAGGSAGEAGGLSRPGKDVRRLWLPLLFGLMLAAPASYGHGSHDHRPASGGDTAQAGVERSGAGIYAEQGWIRAMPPGQPVTAAFMTLVNPTASERRVVALDSPIAGRVEIHQSLQSQGRSRMEPLDTLAIPAGDRVTLAPGGIHVMLMELRRQPRAGERLRLQLTFDDGAIVDLELPVKDMRHDRKEQHHHHH